MCGRYTYTERIGYEVERELEIERDALAKRAGGITSAMDEGDVTPGSSPIVLLAKKGDEKREICISNMFWGIMGKDNHLVINARAESAYEKPMFAYSVENRRCILPASAFYEWDMDKNRVTFFRKDHSPIYLAGFYKLSENRDSFVILTTKANESMIRVHDRMPLMIEKSSVRDWLFDKDAAREMLKMEMPLLESRQDYQQLSLF